MKINDVVVLNSDYELRVFYYNADPKFPDHDKESPEVGRAYTIVGFVPEKSNKLHKDKESGDYSNYAYVIRDNKSAELFRISHNRMDENFVELKKS